MTKQLLNQDPRQAVEEMIKLTNGLGELIEMESNAVATNDGTTFTTNEINKEAAIEAYEIAAAEFRSRINEFKSVDKALITKLEEAQESLKGSTQANLKLLEKFQEEE